MSSNSLKTALLGSGAAVALVAASVSATAGEINELREQVQALQDQINKIESERVTERKVAPAAAVEAGSKPRSILLPGSKTSMQISGYAKLDLIYDLNAADQVGNLTGGAGEFTPGNDLTFFNGVEGTAEANRQGNFRFHARQSRVAFKTWTPTDWGQLATHIEMDFYGPDTGDAFVNETISNSNSMRLRHAYGRLGPVLAGQTWSNMIDVFAYNETIDFHGAVGELFLRQSQLRYTHGLGGGTTLSVSIENPELASAVGAKNNAAGIAPAAAAVAPYANPFPGGSGRIGGGDPAIGVDHLPDFTARVLHRWKGGHLSGAGVVRYLSVDSGTGPQSGVLAGGIPNFSESTVGWGINLSGSYKVTKADTLKWSYYYGQGLGRYNIRTIISESVLVGTSTSDIDFDGVESYGGFLGWRHAWTNTIRSNHVISRNDINVENLIPAAGAPAPGVATAKGNIPNGVVDVSMSVHNNIIWSPVKQVNIGFEHIWVQDMYHNAPSGRQSRFQLGFQYKF